MPWARGSIGIPQILPSELTENSQKSRAINHCFIINHCICHFVTPIPACLGFDVALIFNFSKMATRLAADFAQPSKGHRYPPSRGQWCSSLPDPRESLISVLQLPGAPVSLLLSSWGVVLWHKAVEHIQPPQSASKASSGLSAPIWIYSA